MRLSPEACRDKYPDKCSSEEAEDSWGKVQMGFQPQRMPGECAICMPYQIEKLGHECNGHIMALRFPYVDGCSKCKNGELSEIKNEDPCLQCEEKTVLVPGRVRVVGGFDRGLTPPFKVEVTWKNIIDEKKNTCQKCVIQDGGEGEGKIGFIKDVCGERSDKISAATGGKEYYQCEQQGDIKRCVKKCNEKNCKFCEECKSSSTKGDSRCDDKCDGFRKCLPALDGGSPDCFCPNVTAIERDAPALTEEQKEFYKPCPPDKPYPKLAREDGSGGCECECGCWKSNYECLVSPDGKALGCKCKFYKSDTPSGKHKPNSPAPDKNSEPCDVSKNSRGFPKNKLVVTNEGCDCVPYNPTKSQFSLNMIP